MADATTLSSIDAKEFSVQGIGNVLTYNEPLNTINIDGKINVSLQPGDAIYSTEPGGLRLINTVFSIDRSNNSIRLSGPSPAPIPNPTDFMLFTKDSQVNTSGLLGYYADI